MAPKAKTDPVSPKAKATAKGSSPLGLAGASLMGPSPRAAPTASAAAGTKGSVTSPRGNDSPASGLGAAGSRAVGAPKGNSSARGEALSEGLKKPSASYGSGTSLPSAAGATASAAKAAGTAAPVEAAPAAPRAEASPSPAAAAPAAKPAAASAAKAEVDPEALIKFHSAVRWAKPWPDIEEAANGIDLKIISSEKDPKNGNTVMHIAAQNGHLDLVRKLLGAGAPVNMQNGKGQTPLHMTVEYDFYFVSRILIDAGADPEMTNEDGNKAILGIDGGKTGLQAWDNAVTILRAAGTTEELETAFEALGKALATPELVSKEQLIQVGMAKKKSPATQAVWDHKRFMQLAAKF